MTRKLIVARLSKSGIDSSQRVLSDSIKRAQRRYNFLNTELLIKHTIYYSWLNMVVAPGQIYMYNVYNVIKILFDPQ